MFLSPDLIILGLIAGAILYRLYSILGRKDDDGEIVNFNADNLGNLVDISSQAKVEEVVDLAESEKDLTVGFEEVVANIRKIDVNFSLRKFIDGAKKAFEMVLTAFAEEDRETLRYLLNDNVYNQFSIEIDKRNKNGVKLNLTLVALPLVKIKKIELNGYRVSIDMVYNSQQIAILKNNNGEIIEGSNSQIDNVEDVWTFSKALNTKESWTLTNVNAG